MKAEGWAIYYADGSVYTDEDGSWPEAPSESVQVVMLRHGKDEYGRTLQTAVTGVDEYRLPGDKTVKHGSLMEPESAHDEIRERAVREG